jgi:hypothetical protein
MNGNLIARLRFSVFVQEYHMRINGHTVRYMNIQSAICDMLGNPFGSSGKAAPLVGRKFGCHDTNFLVDCLGRHIQLVFALYELRT